MKTPNALYTALNSEAAPQMAEQPHLLDALCFELSDDGIIPEWVPLIPVGTFTGRDGRTWHNPQPENVIQLTTASNREQPLDWEHSTELKRPKGEEAPAAGWFTDYRINNGHIEGRLEFTPRGLQSVQNREYRYLSPVFRYDNAGNVYDIRSAGLTNMHNLLLPALNQEQHDHAHLTPDQESNDMDLKALLAAIATALNTEITTPEQALDAVKQQATDLQTAKNSEGQPDLASYVPVDTHNQALQRALNAEQELSNHLTTARNAEIDTAIDDAVAAGKIAPSNKEFYRTACNSEDGLANFRKFVASAPVIAPESNLDGKKVTNHKTALNSEEQALADMFGNTAEDLAKYA